MFSYALWPDAYGYPFWSYGSALAYDYQPYVPSYSYGGLSNIYGYTGATEYSGNGPHANQTPPSVTQSCGGFAPGVTSFPIDRIRQALQPTGEQVTALNELADASSKASATLSACCPNEPPLTPLARLDAIEKRLEATIQAIEIVRPVLARFYDALNDVQRQRLDAVGAEETEYRRAATVTSSSGATTLASLCGDQAANFTRLPVQSIEEIIKPTGQQQNAFDKLRQVSENAADELRASCPAQTAQTPVARLDAMDNRLQAMVRAVKTVRPVLGTFYASLSDDQKAQFNSMGQKNTTSPENSTGGRQE